MSIDEQRGFARPDRPRAGTEEIGDAEGTQAPAAAAQEAGASSFDRPGEPKPVAWPGAQEVTRPLPSPAPTTVVEQSTPASAQRPPGDEAPGNGHYAHIWQGGQETPTGDTQQLNEPTLAAPADPWGQPTGDPWIDVTPGTAPTETAGAASYSRGRRIGGAIGLFAAGAVVGALIAGAYTEWRSNDNTALTSQAGQVPGAGGQVPGQGSQGQQGQGQPGLGSEGQGGPGFGLGQGSTSPGGEIRLVGTLTAVSGSKVTVRSPEGSARYTIAPDTRIVRNGATAKASDLQKGDVVLVHAFPRPNADSVLELIYARGAASTNPSTGGGAASSGDDSTT